MNEPILPGGEDRWAPRLANCERRQRATWRPRWSSNFARSSLSLCPAPPSPPSSSSSSSSSSISEPERRREGKKEKEKEREREEGHAVCKVDGESVWFAIQ